MRLKLDLTLSEKIFFCSDTHAFHKNICAGTTEWDCSPSKLRRFQTPEEMTEEMADNFNSVIPEDGYLFHTGDFSFAGKENIKRFREMLNVKNLVLITGNHDHHIEKGDYDYLFTVREKYMHLSVGKELNLILFHHPIQSWDGMGKGFYHLHGHQHWTANDRFGNGRMMDVGVDGGALFPYSLNQIVGLLEHRKSVDPKDHHI